MILTSFLTEPMGDTEFVAAFYHFVIPIVKQFQPDMIFVSAGFDAAEGHPENVRHRAKLQKEPVN